MRISRFHELVAHEFGPAQGRILVRDTVLGELGHRTAQEALDGGAEPQQVWFALCAELEVPAKRRWGPDRDPRP